ncbi:MAG: AAA family ATPase [Bacteroidales bacterium]|nr:AAA family ATPase [Bacteroidales bacterium]
MTDSSQPPENSLLDRQRKDTDSDGNKQKESTFKKPGSNGQFDFTKEPVPLNAATPPCESIRVGPFIIRPASNWLIDSKTKPKPASLYDNLFFDGELCILFGDTNLGKSILAVQIADEISQKQKVVYADFELSDMQFYLRYSDEDKYNEFKANFLRCELDPLPDIPDDVKMDDLIFNNLRNIMESENAKVLVIDNISYLADQTEKAMYAIPLMRRIKRLQNDMGLSILVVAHTPKRDLTKPLTRNDIQGSKMIVNFADSAIGIGESQQDSSLRYIKQIKARNTEYKYDADNVKVMRIEKIGAFLQLVHVGYAPERDHLRERSKDEVANLEMSIIYLHKENPDLSLKQIADRLDTNKMKVKRVLDKNKGVTDS